MGVFRHRPALPPSGPQAFPFSKTPAAPAATSLVSERVALGAGRRERVPEDAPQRLVAGAVPKSFPPVPEPSQAGRKPVARLPESAPQGLVFSKVPPPTPTLATWPYWLPPERKPYVPLPTFPQVFPLSPPAPIAAFVIWPASVMYRNPLNRVRLGAWTVEGDTLSPAHALVPEAAWPDNRPRFLHLRITEP